MCFNRNEVQLANFHHFAINGKEKVKDECSLFIKHCVINSINEFILRSERGVLWFFKKAEEFRQQGQDIATREAITINMRLIYS